MQIHNKSYQNKFTHSSSLKIVKTFSDRQKLHQQYIRKSLDPISSSLGFLGRVPVSCGFLLTDLLLGVVLEPLLSLLLKVLPPLGLLLGLLDLLLLGQLSPLPLLGRLFAAKRPGEPRSLSSGLLGDSHGELETLRIVGDLVSQAVLAELFPQPDGEVLELLLQGGLIQSAPPSSSGGPWLLIWHLLLLNGKSGGINLDFCLSHI